MQETIEYGMCGGWNSGKMNTQTSGASFKSVVCKLEKCSKVTDRKLLLQINTYLATTLVFLFFSITLEKTKTFVQPSLVFWQWYPHYWLCRWTNKIPDGQADQQMDWGKAIGPSQFHGSHKNGH